jgi:hypothetical protein
VARSCKHGKFNIFLAEQKTIALLLPADSVQPARERGIVN